MADNKTKSKNNKFFNLIFESGGYKEFRTAFDRVFESPIWWFSEKKTLAAIKPLLLTQRPREIEDYISLSEYKNIILRAMRQSGKSKQPAVLSYALNNTYGVAIPLIKDDGVLGYFGVCGVKFKPKQALLTILSGYTNIIINAISKELELAKVYELVRPRAIALSTVHTIHRLISSTLDIKELFPRIARLSLQVLRAERASICMIDPQTKKLACVAAVDYRKTTDMFKVKQKPSPIETRVARTGRCVYRNNLMCVPLVEEEICGVIILRDKVGEDKFSIFDQEILTTLAEQAVIAIRNAQLFKEQEDLIVGTIKSLSYLLDAKFPRIYTHTEFFIELMQELGRELGLDKKGLKDLHYSALLPDLGKLVMPEEILEKEKALSGKERKIIKTHTVRGIEVLKYLDVLKPVVPIILHHHERYDGKGYPDKLKGKNIPLGSRIMAVVDTFEAMVCHRPYRKPMPFRMAVSEIRRHSGKQFDPEVVKVFMHIANNGRLEELIRSHSHELKKNT